MIDDLRFMIWGGISRCATLPRKSSRILRFPSLARRVFLPTAFLLLQLFPTKAAFHLTLPARRPLCCESRHRNAHVERHDNLRQLMSRFEPPERQLRVRRLNLEDGQPS